jgi:membrane carboxypeptidase/penicillin-binding protein
MDMILTKILAAFLALSLVTTRPDSIKTAFDPATDAAEVMAIMRDGCGHMRKAFDVESLDVDDLIKTAMDDPGAISAEIKALHGLRFDSLLVVYRQFCKNEEVKDSPVDLAEVIRFYNEAVADLPDYTRLKGARFTGTSGVLDAKGERFADLADSGRRTWVPLKDIPVNVQKAFIAAEDKRFYEHKGIDERGLVRAMVSNLARPGRPQGGSTITQQVVKNLLVGDDITYERKMREIILASRVERLLTKQEILELYLNSIYLGRGAYGVEMAARNYFGKPASALTLNEGALLAGLPKGPTYYSPDRHPDRAQERLGYVLGRMQQDSDSDSDTVDEPKVALPQMVAYERPQQRDSGYYFLDHVTREARSLPGIGSIAATTLIRTTLRPDLQRAVETALQEGLAQYEMRTGRVAWHGPEANLTDAVRRLETQSAHNAAPLPPPPAPPQSLEIKSLLDEAPIMAPEPAAPPAPGRKARNGTGPGQAGQRAKAPPPTGPAAAATAPTDVTAATAKGEPAWQRALEAAYLPLYDVHWTPAIILANGVTGGAVRVGLPDGRVLPLGSAGYAGRRGLNLYDVVFVKVSDPKSKQARAELRVRPTVQGAAIVLDNKTGGILAVAGGFSFPASQLNRATQAQRQPGSSLKPFTYLAALRSGLQPNTLVRNEPLTLPPIGNAYGSRERDYWSPHNYDGGGGGITTLRRGLENSINLVTAQLLDGGIAAEPSDSLNRVCELTMDAEVYRECIAYYPFVLGAQPARLIDLAAFYAAIATEGRRPTPYSIESVEQNGRTLYTHKPEAKWLASGDRPSFFQLRTMLQGVVARGTARAIGQMSPYVGGKTGTSEDENDAWFTGFTNDVTVGVWVGYDNADGKRRTLGDGQTGGHVAVPIFEPIIEAVWANYAPKTPLNPPSPEARKELAALPIDLRSGNRLSERSREAFTEYFRLRGGRLDETQYLLVSREEMVAERDYSAYPDGTQRGPNGYYSGAPGGYYSGNNYYSGPAYGGGFFGGLFGGFFAPPPQQPPPAQRPLYPPNGPAYGGAPVDIRPRYSEDRRWAPGRRVDPDVAPWRGRQQ